MFVTVNDIDIHLQELGPSAGTPILLLHSIGTQSAIWEETADSLSGQFRTLRIDLRGHGLSSVSRGPYRMDQLARDMLGLLDVLSIPNAHVAGVSLGGMVAQTMAALVPGMVRGLILIDTALAIPPAESWHGRAALVRAKGMDALTETVLPRWVTTDALQSLAARALRNMLLRTDPEGYAGAAEAIAGVDLTATSRRLENPALVLVGEMDVATPLASAQALRDAIPGAELAVIPKAAHLPMMEQGPAVARAMQRFLAKLEPKEE